MTYDPQKHHRRTIRAAEYDYTRPGAYFITICTHQREPLFGRVVHAEMERSPFGEIVHEEWLITAKLRPNVALDAFVVMPNHMHGILFILDDCEARCRATEPVAPTGLREQRLRAGSLGSIIGQFKSASAKRIKRARESIGVPVWQRNYHEHIIRSDRSLEPIRAYIEGNSARWAEDRYYVDNAVLV